MEYQGKLLKEESRNFRSHCSSMSFKGHYEALTSQGINAQFICSVFQYD